MIRDDMGLYGTGNYSLMLRTIGKKMKPLRGFGFLELHFSIDMNSLREKT
jgi:hypothetical protein